MTNPLALAAATQGARRDVRAVRGGLLQRSDTDDCHHFDHGPASCVGVEAADAGSGPGPGDTHAPPSSARPGSAAVLVAPALVATLRQHVVLTVVLARPHLQT
ncbi:MAG: hypothetical protein ACR2LU_01495, partial [Luteitalea sp.]